MNIKKSAPILIIIGIIIMAFPILGIIPFSLITGIVVSIIGIGILITALTLKNENTRLLGLIAAAILLVLGIGFLLNPVVFSFVASLFVFIAGLFLIAVGIANILEVFGEDIRIGIISIVLGLIYLAISALVSDISILGALIGLWIIFTGVLMLFLEEDKYVNNPRLKIVGLYLIF